MNARLKLFAALAVMFLLGGVAGLGVGFFLHPHFPPHPRPGEIDRHMLDFWTRELGLSAAQQEQVKPLASSFARQAEALHDDTDSRFSKLADATDDQLAQYLTDTQKKALDHLRRQRKEDDHRLPTGARKGPMP